MREQILVPIFIDIFSCGSMSRDFWIVGRGCERVSFSTGKRCNSWNERMAFACVACSSTKSDFLNGASSTVLWKLVAKDCLA